MTERKELIEQIMANIYAMKNKMNVKMMSGGIKNRITHSQWFVLCLIGQHKNLGIKEISQILGITSSATTQLVDGLVESGFVERKTSKTDKRSLQLCVSKKGQRQMKEIKLKYIKVMEKLFSSLTDKDLKMYNQLNEKILENITRD